MVVAVVAVVVYTYLVIGFIKWFTCGGAQREPKFMSLITAPLYIIVNDVGQHHRDE